MARKMKDSGIEWIGEIPEEWEISKVANFFDIQLGKMLQPEPYTKEDTLENYLCAANLGGNKLKIDDLKQMWFSEGDKLKFEVRKGDLLVVEGGDVASCDILNENIHDLFIQNAIHRVRGKYGNDLRILRYYLMLAKTCGYIDLICNKATIAHFTKEKFSSMPYPVIPINEQHVIADFLDQECSRIDEVIAKTKETIEEYKKLKQAVITESVTKGIRPNRKMKDSGIEWIGRIPDNWKTKSIKYLAITCSGGTPNSNDLTLYDGDINWVCSYDLNETPIFKSGRTITQAGANAIAGRMQIKGSVLVAMYGGAGTIGNSGILECDARTNQAICSIKFDNNYINDYFGFYYIIAIRKYWMIYAVGTRKDPNISQDIVKKMPCVIPPMNEQKEILDFIKNHIPVIEKQIDQKRQLINDLEFYKKSLIYEYVTGKKEVPA